VSGTDDEFLFTVDVEPDWGFTGDRAVREMLPRLLDLLDARAAAATFFVASGMLDSCRDVLMRIGRRHEIGSHGVTHRRIGPLPVEERRRELVESKRRLEDELGRAVAGVRAPFFARSPGWLSEVAGAGYRYDASDGWVRPSLGNLPYRARRPVRAGAPVPSIPVSTFTDGVTPCSLTWLRLYAPFGLPLLRRNPRMFYFHLHEFLPPETAGRVNPLLRPLLTRHCGERAWELLGAALDRIPGERVTCSRWLVRRGLLDAEGGSS
jgi:peptidoglycan/xylan/chitin deacetylase (PgdA/CDA1 family)